MTTSTLPIISAPEASDLQLLKVAMLEDIAIEAKAEIDPLDLIPVQRMNNCPRNAPEMRFN